MEVFVFCYQGFYMTFQLINLIILPCAICPRLWAGRLFHATSFISLYIKKIPTNKPY